MRAPEVSVVMATYNGGPYVEEQLDSILAQSMKDIEVIVVDDGSTDGTLAVVRSAASRDSRVRVLAGAERLGVKRNFERGLKVARGEFVALSDQDDVWVGDKLFALLGGIGDAQLVFSDMRIVDSDGRVRFPSFAEMSPYVARSGVTAYDLLFRKCIYGCSMMFRRTLLDALLPFPDGVAHHDWWLAVGAARLGGIAYVDRPLTRYRRHEDNASDSLDTHRLLGKVRLMTSRPAHERRRNARKEIVSQLEVLQRTAWFSSSSDRAVTDDCLAFYRSYVEGRGTFAVLPILVRRSHLLFPRAWGGVAELCMRAWELVWWGRARGS